MKIKKYWILFWIVVLAFLLRIVYLDYSPPSLNWDEVSHGYNAYSILKTGKDEWGETLPLIFRAYGDYKLPVYIYTTVPFIALFGLNSFAVRLPSVLAGTGIVIFTYLLTSKLFSKKEKNSLYSNYQLVALLSALLVAIEPWSFFLSRGAFEANLALLLFLSGVYFFLKAFEKGSYLLLSVFFLGLTVWTYNSFRIVTPIMFGVLVLLYKDDLQKIFRKSPKYFYLSLITVLVLLVPMIFQLINPVGQARYSKVSLIDEGSIAQIIEYRKNSPYSSIVTRLIYNRPSYFLSRFLSNWVSHFKPGFLFFTGGDHYQFSVPGHGLIYLLNLPFFIIGIFLIIKELLRKNKVYMFLFSWLVFAPIPSSLTREAPHVLRSITMLPIPMIITAIGCAWFVFQLKNKHKLLLILYMALLFVFAKNYLARYFGNYAKDYSWVWQYGYKEVVSYAVKNYSDYEKIIVTKKYGEPHEFFLFFTSWDPDKYRNDPNLIRFYQSNWYWVDKFDKFYFVNDWKIPKEGSEFVMESGGKIGCGMQDKCLLVTSPGNVPTGWIKLETVDFLNGKPAFEIYDNSFKDIGMLR